MSQLVDAIFGAMFGAIFWAVCILGPALMFVALGYAMPPIADYILGLVVVFGLPISVLFGAFIFWKYA